jgi:hypothetical protein
MGIWVGFLTAKPVPFHYLPDLQFKTTLVHQPIVRFVQKMSGYGLSFLE